MKVPPELVGLYLGYFAGFLLYRATVDILPESHAGKPFKAPLFCTLAGVACMPMIAALRHRGRIIQRRKTIDLSTVQERYGTVGDM